jgi:hypothetical protein
MGARIGGRLEPSILVRQFPVLAGTADVMRMVLSLLLLVAGCVGHSVATDQQARYRTVVGRSEAELIQKFGQPTQRENVEGHEFLVYQQSDVWSGQRGGAAPLGRHEPGAASFECRAIFVVVAGIVSTYSLSGSGC